MLLLLYRYNLRRYGRKIHHHSSLHNLSERYQLSENIRTTRQLTPVLFLHFASNAEVSLQFLAIYYGLVTEPASRQWLTEFGLVFNAAAYFLIQLAVIKHHPIVARRINELFGRLFCRRDRRRRQAEVSGVVSETGRQNVRDLHGSRLITEQNAEGDLHFRMLRSHWADVQEARVNNAIRSLES